MQVAYEPGTNLIKFVWKFALKQSPPRSYTFGFWWTPLFTLSGNIIIECPLWLTILIETTVA